MTRAIMEGVALKVRDMMDGWFKAGVEITTLRLGGSATKFASVESDPGGRVRPACRDPEDERNCSVGHEG